MANTPEQVVLSGDVVDSPVVQVNSTEIALEVEQPSLEELSDLTPEEYKKRKATVKAKMLSLLDRGITNERLLIPLPANLYGEWVPSNPSDIKRFEAMGFQIDDKYSKANALHQSNRVADVVFMTAPRYVKEAIDEIRNDRFTKMHGKPGVKNKTNLLEETDFHSKTDLPVVNESVSTQIGYDEIKAALGQ